jgi:adenosine deaminase
MNDVDISISSDDISFRDRFIYSYIVVVQQEMVKAELP